MNGYQTFDNQPARRFTLTIDKTSGFAHRLHPHSMRMDWGQLLFTFYQLPVRGLKSYIHTPTRLTIVWETENPATILTPRLLAVFHSFTKG